MSGNGWVAGVDRRPDVRNRFSGINIEICSAYGGAARIIACVEDSEFIEKILTHLESKARQPQSRWRPPCRVSPELGLVHGPGFLR